MAMPVGAEELVMRMRSLSFEDALAEVEDDSARPISADLDALRLSCLGRTSAMAFAIIPPARWRIAIPAGIRVCLVPQASRAGLGTEVLVVRD